ncbi:MAG TPA: hypothetical protein VN647_03335, partial [Nitrospira sp.]|nr:hypothetical protein [Nitrospira sp.]
MAPRPARFDRDAFHGKVEPGESMLSVDHQVLSLRLAQVADGIRAIYLLEAKCFIGKEKHRAGNHRLRHDSLIKVDDLFDLLPIQDPLESLLASLDSRNKLRHIVMVRNLRLCDLFTLKVVSAGEPNLVQELTGLVRDEIKCALFLRNPRREHGASMGLNRSRLKDSTRPSPWPQDKGLCY